jgi:riboflavin kinase, archaea type
LNVLTFLGKVTSGEGNGRKYLQLSWVLTQIEEKLGFTPYLGTLNLTLAQESAENKKLLKKAETFQISPAKGYCAGLLVKGFVGGLECAIVLPQVPTYPELLLELIAPVNLRDALAIKDGDFVTVTVAFG